MENCLESEKWLPKEIEIYPMFQKYWEHHTSPWFVRWCIEHTVPGLPHHCPQISRAGIAPDFCL